MEAAFEILQSDGSTRSTLSLRHSDAGSGPPTAPKDSDLLHKLAHPILCSAWRGLYFFISLLYNRWVEALCWILSHFFMVASCLICAQYATVVLPTHTTAALTSSGSRKDGLQQQPENQEEPERKTKRKRGNQSKVVNPSCLIKPVTIRQWLQLPLVRFIPQRDGIMERGGNRWTGGGIVRVEPRDLNECSICCVRQGDESLEGWMNEWLDEWMKIEREIKVGIFKSRITFPLDDPILHLRLFQYFFRKHSSPSFKK